MRRCWRNERKTDRSNNQGSRTLKRPRGCIKRAGGGQDLTSPRGPSIASEETPLLVLLTRGLAILGRHTGRGLGNICLSRVKSSTSPIKALKLRGILGVKMLLLTRGVIACGPRGWMVWEAHWQPASIDWKNLRGGLASAFSLQSSWVFELAGTLRALLSSFRALLSGRASLASCPIGIENDRNARIFWNKRGVQRKGVAGLNEKQSLEDELPLIGEGILKVPFTTEPVEEQHVSENCQRAAEAHSTMSQPKIRNATEGPRARGTHPRGVRLDSSLPILRVGSSANPGRDPFIERYRGQNSRAC